jgi:molybdate transport system regulatory protein
MSDAALPGPSGEPAPDTQGAPRHGATAAPDGTSTAAPLAAATGTRVVIRLDHGARGRIGPGKIAVLEHIGRTGAIASAARALGMSYPRALALLVQIEATLGEAAVLRAAGGTGGGGATLTEAALALIARYRAIETAAQTAADGL